MDIFIKNRPAQVVFLMLGATCVVGINYRVWFASFMNMILRNCGLEPIAPFNSGDPLTSMVTLAGMLIGAMGVAIGGEKYAEYKRECRGHDCKMCGKVKE